MQLESYQNKLLNHCMSLQLVCNLGNIQFVLTVMRHDAQPTCTIEVKELQDVSLATIIATTK